MNVGTRGMCGVSFKEQKNPLKDNGLGWGYGKVD